MPEAGPFSVRPAHEGASVRTGPAPLPALAPLGWLAAGWQDFHHTGYRAAFYGLVFASMGWAIGFVYETQWQLTMGLTAGFFLLGPFVCAGIHELSRQRERGERPDLLRSLSCWRRAPGSIGFFAAMLTLLMIVWARVSVVLFALSSTTEFPTMRGMLAQIASASNFEFLALWGAVGFVFASLVFAISIVSMPMMLDRGADTMVAVFTSARGLAANPAAAYVWAASIVVLIGASLVFWLGLLVVTAPLVGHATWHAYRALVAPASG
ncbi:MAG: DUF2189 domain-containing protein [Burkholderiaceae bacterium]|nr:DUF2189 domain-containing protein [Burkholderiaceae bacterium]